MATQEELQALANQEIEDAKPMYAQVNNERREFTDAEYAQAKTDLGNSKWDTQQFGYIQARQEAYGSWQQQMDMQFWDTQGNTTTWADHIAKVKSDNPKPS
jgi:hypothetical protein